VVLLDVEMPHLDGHAVLARVHAAVRSKALQDELRLRNAELELASRTDALTGLRNRRHLEEQLQRLAAEGDRLSVLVCDIDRFKQVNDTRGHAAGDEVLRVAAGRLRAAARPGDVPGRWGGEKFLVVLPGTGSVGVASGVEDGWEGLVRRADTGLYAAKEGGRDRVVAGPAAGSRPSTPEGQDAARYR
jgi:two-component system, cell cycle response regulator